VTESQTVSCRVFWVKNLSRVGYASDAGYSAYVGTDEDFAHFQRVSGVHTSLKRPTSAGLPQVDPRSVGLPPAQS
jgi:hypothetical protein